DWNEPCGNAAPLHIRLKEVSDDTFQLTCVKNDKTQRRSHGAHAQGRKPPFVQASCLPVQDRWRLPKLSSFLRPQVPPPCSTRRRRVAEIAFLQSQVRPSCGLPDLKGLRRP